MWEALAGVAGTQLIGGYLQARAARDAAEIQGRASEAATAEQRRQFDIGRSDLTPWREAGTEAVGRLRDLMGPEGELSKKFTVADFLSDPVTQLSYQHGLDEGTKAIDRMAGARGSRNSGATLKALTRFGTDYTGSKAGESYGRFYGDQDRLYNRLAGVAGTGQTATTAGVNAGQNAATNIGNLMTAQGNARGASAIAQGNAWGGALSNIGNFYQNQMVLDRLTRPTA